MNAKDITALIVVGVGLLAILGVSIHSCSQANEIQALTERNQAIQTRLADETSLVLKYRDSTGTLSEKYSRVGEDFSSFKRTARQEDAQKSRTILAYQTSVQEFRIENQRLRGQIQKDSAGNVTGFYVDTVTTNYILQAGVYLAPPFLDIILLQIPDSSSVVFSEDKEGYVYGQIGHSNPYIYDSGANFQISLSGKALQQRSAFGWMVGAGAVYSGSDTWGPAFLAGAKLYDWGLAGFIAQNTRGLLIMRDF